MACAPVPAPAPAAAPIPALSLTATRYSANDRAHSRSTADLGCGVLATRCAFLAEFLRVQFVTLAAHRHAHQFNCKYRLTRKVRSTLHIDDPTHNVGACWNRRLLTNSNGVIQCCARKLSPTWFFSLSNGSINRIDNSVPSGIVTVAGFGLGGGIAGSEAAGAGGGIICATVSAGGV